MTKRKEIYYVGAENVEHNWSKNSFEEAVAHAEELVARDKRPRNIVKVVGRVSLATPPMKVERFEEGE